MKPSTSNISHSTSKQHYSSPQIIVLLASEITLGGVFPTPESAHGLSDHHLSAELY